MESPGQIGELSHRLLLPPQLKQVRAAAEQLRRRSLSRARRDVAEIENRVELAARVRTLFRRLQSRIERFDGRSSNDSEFIMRSTNPVS